MALLGPAAAAFAHPILVASTPSRDAVVPPSLDRVTLRFNNRIEKRLCRIRVVDDKGAARSLAVAPSEGDAETLVAPLRPPLAAGRYHLEWRAMSTDGHVVNGALPFRVAP